MSLISQKVKNVILWHVVALHSLNIVHKLTPCIKILDCKPFLLSDPLKVFRIVNLQPTRILIFILLITAMVITMIQYGIKLLKNMTSRLEVGKSIKIVVGLVQMGTKLLSIQMQLGLLFAHK